MEKEVVLQPLLPRWHLCDEGRGLPRGLGHSCGEAFTQATSETTSSHNGPICHFLPRWRSPTGCFLSNRFP